MILLSFDDDTIQDWYEIKDLFSKYNSTATFYCSNINTYTNKEWEMLKELQGLGHTIGYHGLNHLRPGAVEKEEDFSKIKDRGQWHEDYTDWDKFETHEIEKGLDIMLSRGLKVEHYSYPYGNCSEESHKRLLKWFKTLRTGGNKSFTKKEIKETKIIPALNFGKKMNQKWSGHESRINWLVNNNKIGAFYMHIPKIKRLKWLLKKTKTKGLDNV